MTPGYATSEFWISAVVSLLGMAATLGFVTPDQASTLTSSITAIVGAVTAIYTTVRYIRSRTDLKVAAINAIGAARIGRTTSTLPRDDKEVQDILNTK